MFLSLVTIWFIHCLIFYFIIAYFLILSPITMFLCFSSLISGFFFTLCLCFIISYFLVSSLLTFVFYQWYILVLSLLALCFSWPFFYHYVLVENCLFLCLSIKTCISLFYHGLPIFFIAIFLFVSLLSIALSLLISLFNHW